MTSFFSVITLVVWIHSLSAEASSHQGKIEEYCQWGTFAAECKQNEVIVMETARYGRMRLGTCVKEDFGHIPCSQNIRSYMDSLCSGRSSCDVAIPDENMRAIKPCSELESYLEASYSCKEVITADRSTCHTDSQLVVRSLSGTLSSIQADKQGLGTHRCPWVLQAGPGQKINLTLIDFGLAVRHGGTDNQKNYASSLVCQRYANIREPGSRSTTICGGDERQKNIYVSEGHQVEVEVVPSQNGLQTATFLLQFHVMGCADPRVGTGSTLSRNGNRATIHCKSTQTSWAITCVGNTWKGVYDNCTTPAESWDVWEILSNDWSSPQGIVVVTCLGIALGIIIGVILLITALICMKRKRSRRSDLPPPMVPVDGSIIEPREMLMTNDSGNSGPFFHKDDQYASYRWKNRPLIPLPPDSEPYKVPGSESSQHTYFTDSSTLTKPGGVSTFRRGRDDHIYELPK